MRTHGTLKKWNEDRGFGFISPSQGDEIFVHISAFPRDGIRPRINELISFEVEPGSKGKMQAVRVVRPAGLVKRHAMPRQAANLRRSHSSISRSKYSLIGILLVATVGTCAYLIAGNSVPVVSPFIAPPNISGAAAKPPTRTNFKCDGRTMCSQMNSCAEATYFLQNCPTVKMDGDNDGRPCEQQLCNH